MYEWLKKYVDPIIPLFAILPLISCFALNMLVYSGSMYLCTDWYHHDLTSWLDNQIPLVSEWMYIYFGCYLFWIVNYILVARVNRDNREYFYRFVMTDMMSRLLCAVFFIGFPTTNTRPAVTLDSFSDQMLAFLYRIDMPANLFPSIHCLVSWLCFVGIRKNRLVSPGYKAFSCVLALMVVLSTWFTKQHYIIDGVVGILIAEGLFWLNQKINAFRAVEYIFNRLNYRILAMRKQRRSL